MLLAIRVDLIGELSDNNILFSLLLLYRLLHDEDFLSLRNRELKGGKVSLVIGWNTRARLYSSKYGSKKFRSQGDHFP